VWKYVRGDESSNVRGLLVRSRAETGFLLIRMQRRFTASCILMKAAGTLLSLTYVHDYIPYRAYIGWARIIYFTYVRCMNGILSREITIHTYIRLYTVCIYASGQP
jgi:hypothetical protein